MEDGEDRPAAPYHASADDHDGTAAAATAACLRGRAGGDCSGGEAAGGDSSEGEAEEGDQGLVDQEPPTMDPVEMERRQQAALSQVGQGVGAWVNVS